MCAWSMCVWRVYVGVCGEGVGVYVLCLCANEGTYGCVSLCVHISNTF